MLNHSTHYTGTGATKAPVCGYYARVHSMYVKLSENGRAQASGDGFGGVFRGSAAL